jgi:hypothetical protein
MIKARGFGTFYRGDLADFVADHRIWPIGVTLVVNDSAQIRNGDGLNQFDDLKPIWEQDMTPAQKVVSFGTTTDLTAIGGVFADLAAARTGVNTLRTDVEARLDAIETKFDLLLAHLITSGEMKAS